MSTRHFIIATAGHVDHGKSALVKALTGTDPDRLPEEKARGITIDLGFAHLELPSSPLHPPATLHLGIVDVPGHEDFVKNMVAGVGSIDLALFVVAADDGWMPQTEEHLQILSYLGVRAAVVALTKIDLAPDEAARVAHVREQLRNSPFSDAPIIPTSVIDGRGIDALKAALSETLESAPAPRDLGKPRLSVDRVFMLRGIGTVVTGTLIGGEFSRGQNVLVQPAGRTTRIRSLQNHNHDVERSGPGTRTAVNLPDLESTGPTAGIQRGDVVTLAGLGGPCDQIDVLIEKSSRLINGPVEGKPHVENRPAQGAARHLKDGTLVRVHFGSANQPARVALLDSGPLLPGERKLAQLRFEAPVFAFAGDRFIVRDWSEQATLGGGIILDPDASRAHFRGEARRAFLQARAGAMSDASVLVASQLTRDRAVRRDHLLVKSRFSATELEAAIAKVVSESRGLAFREWLADATWWRALRQSAISAIDTVHQAHPEQPGLNLNELRAVVEKQLPAPELFEELVADLCRDGFTQVATAIRRSGHRPALPPHLHAAGVRVRASLSAKPIDPPSRKEIAPDALAQQALRFLLQTGEAVDLGDEVVLLADSYARATDSVRKHLRDRGAATASELRQVLGTSRRIVIPLLERLDKEGVTRRDGDKRVLKPALAVKP